MAYNMGIESPSSDQRPFFWPQQPIVAIRVLLSTLSTKRPLYGFGDSAPAMGRSKVGFLFLNHRESPKMEKYTYLCERCHGNPHTMHAPRKSPYYCRSCQWKREKEFRRRRSGTSKLKKKLISEQGSICEDCGQEAAVMLHHIIPVSEGGKTKRNNVALLCQDCHKKRHGGRGVGPESPSY